MTAYHELLYTLIFDGKDAKALEKVIMTSKRSSERLFAGRNMQQIKFHLNSLHLKCRPFLLILVILLKLTESSIFSLNRINKIFRLSSPHSSIVNMAAFTSQISGSKLTKGMNIINF